MLLKEQKEREKARSIEDKKAIMALRSKRRRGERKLTKEEALRARLPESALLRNLPSHPVLQPLIRKALANDLAHTVLLRLLGLGLGLGLPHAARL